MNPKVGALNAHSEPDMHVLFAECDSWRQVLVYPSAGTCSDGIRLYPEMGAALWIELHTGKVWGFVLRDNSALLAYRELKHIVPLLETGHPSEYQEVCARIAFLTGRNAPSVPDAATHTTLCTDLTASWLATQLDDAPPEAWATIATEILPHVETALGEGLCRFHAALDPEALACAGSALLKNDEDIRHYDYFIHANPDVQRNRRQAARVYPWAAEIVSMPSDDYRVQRLRQNIDSGNPLIPLLAEHYGVTRRVLRYMVGKDYALIGATWRGNLTTLLKLLDLLKPERYPRNAEDWQGFNRWVNPLYRFTDRGSGVSSATLAVWLEELLREGYAAIPARFAAQGITPGDIEAVPDLQRALLHWALAAAPELSEATVFDAMAHYGILRLAALSQRWHAALARWMERDAPAATDEKSESVPAWPTFIDQSWPCNELNVVPLTNILRLKDEGQRMQHCVGTYASQCLFLGAHIFSIRDTDGISLSTAELRPRNENGIWRVDEVQHRAHANDEPSAACRTTLARFIAHLDYDIPQQRYAAIEWELTKRRANSDDYHDILRYYDWPPWMLREFAELLHDYPLLAALENGGNGDENDGASILTQEEVDALLKGVTEDEVREMITMVEDFTEKYGQEATADEETPQSDYLTPKEGADIWGNSVK